MSTSSLPFPTAVSLAKADVEQNYWRCVDSRCADSSYHFAVVVPRAWRPLDTPVAPPQDDGALVSLAVIRPAAVVTAELEVSACKLPREVAPADWLDLYIESLGLEVLARRVLDTAGGAVADILTRTQAEAGDEALDPLITRWLAIKNYDRLFVLQGRALAPNYASEAESLFIALTNFILLQPIDWPLAERLRSFSRRLPGDFLLLYPESWQLTEDPGNSARALQVSLIQRVADIAVGELAFVTVARAAETDPQALATIFTEDLRRGGATAPNLVLTPAAPKPGFSDTWSAATVAVRGEQKLDVKAWVGARPDAWFFLGLIGPTRETQAEAWAVNSRAFDLVLQRLTVVV